MAELRAIADCPSDSAWWRNRRQGRRLVCAHTSFLVYVRVVDAFCVRCGMRMAVKTAPASTAGRLTGAA